MSLGLLSACGANAQINIENRANSAPTPKPPENDQKGVELYDAVEADDYDRVKNLLAGADPNYGKKIESSDDVFYLPLASAIRKDNLKIARILLENSADVNKDSRRKHSLDGRQDASLPRGSAEANRPKNESSPNPAPSPTKDPQYVSDESGANFRTAVIDQNPEMMKLLIEYNVKLVPRAEQSVNDLFEARDPAVLDVLMANGYDINFRNCDECDSVLLNAVMTDDLSLVKAIIKYKPALSPLTKTEHTQIRSVSDLADQFDDLTPLKAARWMKFNAIEKELIKAGAEK